MKRKTIKFRYGMNATIITILFIVLVIMINLLTSALAERYPSMNIDLSENKQFVLSDETVKAISALKKDVKITVVLYDNDSDIYYDEFIKRYKELSSKISSEYVDPVKNPSAVNKYSDDIDPKGSFIIECGDRHEVIDASLIDGNSGRMEEAESLMTNAIVSITADKKNVVKFTTGHGEAEFDGLRKIFENKYFDVENIDLKTGEVGECDMIVIAAPDQDFTQQELNIIDEFAKTGKSVQIYINPEARYLSSLCDYIKEWGIEVKDEIVKENAQDRVYADYNGYVPVVNDSDYTKGISSQYPIIYEPAYRLDVIYTGTRGTEITEILKTSDKATTVTGENENSTAAAYNVALVSERLLSDDVTRMRLFVAGSSLNLKYPYDVISGIPANKQLANAIISKMSGTGSYIEIPSKKSDLQALRVTITQAVFIVVIIILISLALIITGIIIWRRRRFM